LQDPGVDGYTSKHIVKIQDGRAWTGFIWLRIKTGGKVFVIMGNEPSGSTNCDEFLD
jgi:hypothetical protein